MLRLVAFAFGLLLAAASVRAEVVPDLWRGQAIITGQDNLPERARGVRVALMQVLVKVSGDDRLLHQPALPDILRDAERFVGHFEYEDRKKGIQISDEQGTRDRSFHFRVDFDRSLLGPALQGLGAREWDGDRPRLLVVLAVTDLRGSFVTGLSRQRGLGQMETLVLEAGRRGLPLVLPRQEALDRLMPGPEAVAAASADGLRALAAAHAADAVLGGRMAIDADGYWETAWTLVTEGVMKQWPVPTTTFDRAIADGLGRSARILSGAE